MKIFLPLVAVLATVHIASSFMTFSDLGKLRRCYHERGNRRMSEDIVNGQRLPLPSSLETFVSLVERLESAYPSMPSNEMIRKLFVSFRVDEVPGDFRFEDPVWTNDNLIERALFNIDNINYAWKAEDISEDEQCALHFMLSHSINDTLSGEDNEEAIDGVSKNPREYGVVSLYGKPKHAFSLGKVLLGIYGGLLGNSPIDAAELKRRSKSAFQDDGRLNGIKINRLVAATLADLVILYIRDKSFKRGEISFMPNGAWNDVSCTTEYKLEDNNKRITSNSVLRGAVDGLILGYQIEANQNYYKKLRLSEILRMYYGPTGLLGESATSSKADIRSDIQWCKRMDNLRAIPNFNEDVLNYLKFYANLPKSQPTEDFQNEINEVIGFIQGSTQIFNDVTDEAPECSKIDSALDKCKTPTDIFAILDWATNENQKNMQIELLGLLSTDFEIRPYGNSLGAYTNFSPMQNRGLHVIANNTGISGCPACFARYFKRVGSSRQGEVEVLMNLNQTLTEFIEIQDSSKDDGMIKAGNPSKVVLLFNFGSPADDHKLREAHWEIVKNFREVTILAIGTKKESLQIFTENYDTDVFTDVGNAAALAIKLKQRICKAPAEFTFKECSRSSRSTEGDNKQSGFLPPNKKQYWAMFPKYFLKSYSLKLKFKALDGAQIKVCYSRSYYRILEDNTDYKECREPGEEVEFYASNPCLKRNEHNCDPFYFSLEGVKPANGICDSIHCRNPKDIVFEFSHEGISCNGSTFVYSSTFLLLLALLFTYLQRN